MTFDDLVQAEADINVPTQSYTPIKPVVEEHKEEIIVGEVVQEREAKLILEG